jgi:hypothetical protein
VVTTQLVHVTGAACAKVLKKYNSQVVNTKGILNDFPHKGDSQTELAYCSWMKINKKPTNKANIFLFIKAHALA